MMSNLKTLNLTTNCTVSNRVVTETIWDLLTVDYISVSYELLHFEVDISDTLTSIIQGMQLQSAIKNNYKHNKKELITHGLAMAKSRQITLYLYM